MCYQSSFERKELKYLLPPEVYQTVRAAAEKNMEPDRFPTAAVTSLYYDTPSRLLIRRSLEQPDYKEKLRVRVYGKANETAAAYVEIKKKYKGVVYKRRTALPVPEAAAWLGGEKKADPTRIEAEIEHFLDFYKDLAPSMLIACERDSFFEPAAGFRLTFDKNIRFRENDLSLLSGSHGELLLPQGTVLMEAKAPGVLPQWFIRILSENKIYKTSFSKYGAAYTKRLAAQLKGGQRYA